MESTWSSHRRLGLCLIEVGISQRSRQCISGRRNSGQRPGAGEVCSVFWEPYADGVGALSPGMGVVGRSKTAQGGGAGS